jgi:hypothetical protein
VRTTPRRDSTSALFGPFDCSASRTQVRAEAIEARRLGLLEPATLASVQR